MKTKRKFSEGLLDTNRVTDELKISPGQTIIDAGCGNGYMSIIFSELVGKSGRVFALDSNRHFIDELKKDITSTNITAVIDDITRQSRFPKNSIDTIYLSNVFHIFSSTQIDGFRREVTRILKPNGVLAIVSIKKVETPFGPPLEMRSSPEELINKVQLKPIHLVSVSKYFYMQIFQNQPS